MDATRTNARRVLWLTCYGHAITHLAVLIFPALLVPLAHHFDRDPYDALILGQGMYLVFGLGALPAGLLADRFGGARMLRLFLFLTGAALVATGLARTPVQFAVAATFLGAAVSVYHPVGLSLISKTIPNRGWALGINGVFGNIGLATAPFLTGILSWLFGWRWAYLGLAAPTLLVAVLSLLLPIDETVRIRRAPRPAEHSARMPLYFAVLCVALVMGGFAYRGISVILPAAFEERAPFLGQWLASLGSFHLAGLKTLAATMLTSLVYVVGIVGQIAGGRVADRHDLRRLYVLFHACSLPGLLLMAVLTDVGFFIAAIAYIFFSLGMQPIENSLVATLTPDRLRSTAYGIKFTLTFGIGSVAVSFARVVAGRAGASAVFVSVAGSVVVLVAAASLLWYLSRDWKAVND